MGSNEHREFQRLRLGKPILALLDDENTLILDLGVSGAFVEHYGKASPGARMTLLFRWKAADLGFLCEVIHTDVVRSAASDVISHTGLRFVEAIGKSDTRVNDMVATLVGKILAAQRKNAAAVGDANDAITLADVGGARRARSRNYVTYRFRGGEWSRSFTDSAAQPDDGFTVAAFEDQNELKTLCETYEAGDDEARRLIRLVAELSARAVKK
jgi:hypothetical protein